MFWAPQCSLLWRGRQMNVLRVATKVLNRLQFPVLSLLPIENDTAVLEAHLHWLEYAIQFQIICLVLSVAAQRSWAVFQLSHFVLFLLCWVIHQQQDKHCRSAGWSCSFLLEKICIVSKGLHHTGNVCIPADVKWKANCNVAALWGDSFAGKTLMQIAYLQCQKDRTGIFVLPKGSYHKAIYKAVNASCRAQEGDSSAGKNLPTVLKSIFALNFRHWHCTTAWCSKIGVSSTCIAYAHWWG